eukprot:TRINITY_DN638_c2_g1_i3.p10 TRINITY_DN638_c2_g1~~TRINITY_DN638_c2_g1_i3.p10  ORF type:complete len:117 (-),score=5.73 TRINITY_DN638_c2_g1_i3:157-507(-)
MHVVYSNNKYKHVDKKNAGKHCLKMCKSIQLAINLDYMRLLSVCSLQLFSNNFLCQQDFTELQAVPFATGYTLNLVMQNQNCFKVIMFNCYCSRIMDGMIVGSIGDWPQELGMIFL